MAERYKCGRFIHFRTLSFVLGIALSSRVEINKTLFSAPTMVEHAADFLSSSGF